MATDSAPPSRNLWQLPTFLMGIAALAGVWYGRPYWQQTPAQRYESDLTSLRQALEKVPVDAGQVQSLLRKVHGVEPPASLKKQAPYVIGSALVVIAESTSNPEEAQEQWKAARKLLETAQEMGLADVDRSRYQYRLAKTWAHTGEPVEKVIESLAKTLNCGDDASEGNRTLAELYLKLEPPEKAKARDCLKEYLAQVLPGRNEVHQRQLNEARLQLGDLYTQLGETEEARKVLERIGPDSPPELLIAARTHLARSYETEGDWTQAVRCLEQARDVQGITSSQRSQVLLRLADCYLKSNRKADSLATLEQIKKGSSVESFVATLRLAEAELSDAKKKEEAVQSLEIALNDVDDPAIYDNKLMPLLEVRTLYERCIQKLRAENAFDLAVRVIRVYGKIAEKGRDGELAAETLQTSGQLLLDQAPQAEPEDRPGLVDQGTTRIRSAAREWQQVASLKKNSLEKGEPLYRAADLYLKAGDQEEALKILDEIGLKVPDFPQERLADVWLKKGEVYVALGNREQARICFQNGIQAAKLHPSSTLLKCRVRLAEVLLKSSDPKLASRAISDLEAALGDPEFRNDPELHESALNFIADAYYQQKEYQKAEVRFRTLLDTYPESPRAILARFHLGQCYWFTAGQEADKCKSAKKLIDDPQTPDDRRREAQAAYEAGYKQYMDWLKKAGEPFRTVESQLLQGRPNPKLSPADADLLRKASLGAADCAFFSGEYEDCVARYDAIATRYVGTVVQLEALRSMWRCYQYYLQKSDKAADTLTQIRTAYLQMPEREFDGSSEVRRRDYWQRWFGQIAPMKK